ncbi:hypothetical protein ACVCAH_34100 [Micromonospora sp. LZ34]
MRAMGETEVRRTVETAWRMEAGRVVAGIAGIVRDGVPANPGAWLVTVSKRRAVDALRRRPTQQRTLAELGRDLDEQATSDFDAAVEDHSRTTCFG